MKAKRCCLFLGVLTALVCSAALGGLEWPEPDEQILTAQPNPALAEIKELQVFIVPPDTEPNKDGLVWEELDRNVRLKLKQTGIKIAQVVYPNRRVQTPDPELRVHIDMLMIPGSQQYVFRVQTSLSRLVYLTKEARLLSKADVWQISSPMQTISVRNMPAKVTKVVLEQIETFAQCYQIANPPGVQQPDSRDAPQAKDAAITAAKTAPAEYKYIASKNSQVFHTLNCRSAKRISADNLVGYNTREEAINAGKRPCKLCTP